MSETVNRYFIYVLVALILVSFFSGMGIFYNVGGEFILDIEPLLKCWSEAYGEGYTPWTLFSMALASMPPTFIIPTSLTIATWARRGYLLTTDLKNLEDRIMYTVYVLVTGNYVDENDQFDGINWFPDTDPITGERTEETDENGLPEDSWGIPPNIGNRGGR